MPTSHHSPADRAGSVAPPERRPCMCAVSRPHNLHCPPQQVAADADNRPSHLREVTCRVHRCHRSHHPLRHRLEANTTRTNGGASAPGRDGEHRDDQNGAGGAGGGVMSSSIHSCPNEAEDTSPGQCSGDHATHISEASQNASVRRITHGARTIARGRNMTRARTMRRSFRAHPYRPSVSRVHTPRPFPRAQWFKGSLHRPYGAVLTTRKPR